MASWLSIKEYNQESDNDMHLFLSRISTKGKVRLKIFQALIQ